MRSGILKRPWVEVGVLHYGVFPLFALSVLYDELLPYFLGMTFALNYAHRHVTLAFVYGDPEEFARRPRLYSLLPVVLLITTITVIALDVFIVMLALMLTWNLYHVLAQKFGFLRIYRATSGADTSRFMERLFVFGGVVPAAFMALAFHRRLLRRFDLGFLVKFTRDIPDEVRDGAAYVSLALYALVGIALLLKWRKSERRNRMYPSFVVSLFFCYAALGIDFIAGYAAFAITHFIEYLAFTCSYAKRKTDFQEGSFMAFMARRSVIVMAIIPTAIGIGMLLWRMNHVETLTYYLIGTSALHFLYDGLLWKLRNKEVSKVLFKPPSAEPA